MKKNKSRYILTIFLFLIVISIFEVNAQVDDLKNVVNLEGSWKFSIGDREEWRQLNFDDSDWESIHVPAKWEDQGFEGYNGFGFYRKKVNIPISMEGKLLYLVLGYIDDVDEVYFNGEKIGSTGSFPPKYETAYNASRKYYIPESLIKYNSTNIIAVKVYDSYSEGGIVSGDIGIFTNNFNLTLDINLQGNWKFKTRDEMDRKNPQYNDSDWENIFVPAKWEDQGYRDYDGYAWYRKTFVYNQILNDKTLVLLVGKIDDVDQVYINGVYVGSTGLETTVEYKKVTTGDYHTAFRGYYFPASLLKKGQPNVVAVRVYDGQYSGGIYEGPVGIVTQENYIIFWRSRKDSYR